MNLKSAYFTFWSRPHCVQSIFIYVFVNVGDVVETWPGPVFSYKLRYIVGIWLVEMAISTNQKPTIYRNMYENTGLVWRGITYRMSTGDTSEGYTRLSSAGRVF